ncbi:MAG: TraB/GumN family protein [Bacteroidia bacterium]|nr:TraB/GumN family protein [Bacteroidia bacterium]
MARFNIYLFPIFVLVLCFSSVFAQNRPEIMDINRSPIVVQPVQAILWEVRKPEIKRPSYIYAVLHIVPADNFFIPEGINSYIEKTEKLVMEVDPSESDPDYLYRGSVPFDSTLDRVLDRKTFERLEIFIADTLSPSSQHKLYNRYSPNALSRQIIADYCLGYRENEDPVDYETYLAKAISLPLKTLNTGWTRATWQEDEFSIREQTQNLLYTLEAKDSLCGLYNEYMMAYRRQDIDALSMLAQEVPDVGWNAHDFVEARNREWVKTLEWQMKIESMFIVVHAVQLPGEFGLLHLLRKAGYEVNPVEMRIPPYKNDPKRYANPKK